MQNSQQIFKLHSEYQPTGDQPQAIEKLVKGFQEGNQFETLLGVTGSGKTFTTLRGRDADLFDQSGYRQEPDRQGRRHEFVLPGLRPQSRCGAQRLPARRISALQVPQSEQPDAGRRLPVQRALTVRCTIEIK